jgi:hypothetical protein
MNINPDIGITVAAIFTMACYTFFFTDKPNIIFKFTEYTAVGISLGYIIVLVLVKNLQTVALEPILGGEVWYVIPILLGLLIYARLTTSYKWLARYPLALIVGVGVGIGGRGSFDAYLMNYIKSAAGRAIINVHPYTAISNLIFVITLVTAVYFFYFTREQTGIFKYISQIGRYSLMIYFGSAFGATILGRAALFIGRAQFLLYDWLGMG